MGVCIVEYVYCVMCGVCDVWVCVLWSMCTV